MPSTPGLEALRERIARVEGLPLGEQLACLAREAAALAGDGSGAGQRLAMLEALRPALWRVLAAFGQQELPRTLPYSAAEAQRWRNGVEGWSVLLAAYLRALADADQGAAELAGLAPLLLQRVMRQAVQLAMACYRAYQPVEPALWQLVHEHLQRAERDGVADVAVDDPTLEPDGRGTVREAWAHLLLLDFCDPYGLSADQLVLAGRWTAQLARHARVSQQPVAHGAAGFLAVDLARGEGMRLQPQPPQAGPPGHGVPRFIDLAGARERVKRQLARLRVGIAPAQLGLGDDCTRDEAGQVLERIYRRWSTRRQRSHPRRQVDEPVSLAPGLAAVLRGVAHLAAGMPAAECPAMTRSRLVDQSANGLGLVQEPGGARLRCHQLVALAGRRELLLGSVRWLTLDPQAGLRFGVRVLAGQARTASLHSSASAPGDGEPALVLPAMPALDLPASLIAAPGTFFAGRELQLAQPGSPDQRVRLERLLEAGADYERISWRPAG